MSRYSWQKRSRGEEVINGCMALILLAFVIFISPLLVWWLWNWIMVSVFAAPAITYWEAFGLRWLCALLFKKNSSIDLED